MLKSAGSSYWLGVLASTALFSGCVEEGYSVVVEPSSELENAEAEVVEKSGVRQQELAGAGVLVEDTSIAMGQYKEVMAIPGCTASVVGPYAVLTAKHCDNHSSVYWPVSGVNFPASFAQINSYVHQPYWPRWWNTLNNAQIAAGGRTDDWPAQHDHKVIFVPGLTPDYLAENFRLFGWKPLQINPQGVSNSQIAIGVSSGSDTTRQFVDVEYAASVPNQITSLNRDGYFNYKKSGTYFTNVQGGDSGGPAIGSYFTPWPAAATGSIEGPRHVLSTHQGAGGGHYSDAGHNAPLAYNINVGLTANQTYTVKLNSLWAKAAISDADGDGLPYQCDSNPASATGSTNLCISPLGSTDVHKPKGLLECDAGYFASGIRGKAGWFIDELAVRCTPVSCLRNPGDTCNDEYWTDAFSGEAPGGSSFSRTCASGDVVTRVGGRHTAGVTLNELKISCENYVNLVDNNTSAGVANLVAVGNVSGTLGHGTLVSQTACPSYGVLKGFEVRSNLENNDVLKYITGVQPVCSGKINETQFTGTHSGVTSQLSCPENYVAVGFGAAPYSLNSSLVGALGLLCMNKSSVASSIAPTDAQLIIAHGSYYLGGNVYPAMTEKYSTFKSRHGLATNYVENKCLNGASVISANIGAKLIGGKYINHVWQFTCKNLSTGLTHIRTMGVGASGGTYATLQCPNPATPYFNGMTIDSGWLTDGVGFTCRD